MDCEKSALDGEGIRPASLVIDAPSLAGSALLLTQKPAQATTDKAVQIPKDTRLGVLEVAKPATQHPIQVGDENELVNKLDIKHILKRA